MRALIITCVVLFMTGLATSQTQTDALEDQAREIGRALRCVVCQNQSIEESDADLAQDMRQLVRDRLAAGDEPEEVITFIRDRYGDYVLLKPPVQKNTYVLWAGPALVLLIGVLLIARRKKPAAAVPSLSEEETTALEQLRRDLDGDGA